LTPSCGRDEAGKNRVAGEIYDSRVLGDLGGRRLDRFDPLTPHQHQLVPPHLTPVDINQPPSLNDGQALRSSR
jgi:hypothetical protein